MVVMLFTFVRLKVAALALGAAGVGELALFMQSIGVIGSLAGLGLGNSAVREVAAAEGRGDSHKRARVIQSLRMLVMISGFLGVLICGSLCIPLSRWTFGDAAHAHSFAVLGVALFFTEIAAGQTALLRGLGRVREIALQSVVVSAGATVVSAALYFFAGQRGIVWSIVATALITCGGSWWYARRVKLDVVPMSVREKLGEGLGMLRMGLAFVWSAVLTSGAAYLIGIMLNRGSGLEANGFYQAAWNLSGIFVGLVLTAMGQDFYPRLTQVIHRKDEACRLINSQTEIGVVLALPGVVATIVFAPWILHLLYSSEFVPAAGALIWFSIGCFSRIVSFPFGYTLLARGDSFWFAVTETVFVLLHLGLAWAGLRFGGLTGLAVGFSLMYFVYAVSMRLLVGRLLGFSYGRETLRIIVFGMLMTLCSTVAGPWVGSVLVAVCIVFSLRGLCRFLGENHLITRRLAALPGGRWLVQPLSQN